VLPDRRPVRMAPKEERQAPVPLGLLRDPAEERQVDPRRRHRALHAVRRRRVRRRGLFRRNDREAGLGGLQAGEADAGAQRELREKARREVWAKTLVVPIERQQVRAGHRQPWRRRVAQLRDRGRVPRARHAGLYDTMETGMGAREQPLMLVITTAGANIAGPCHEKHDEVCKVLDGTCRTTNCSAASSASTRGRLGRPEVAHQGESELRRLGRRGLPAEPAAPGDAEPDGAEQVQDEAPERLDVGLSPA
jgi:hypothetical protein